ncbi:acetyltransferase [Halalkalibacter alkaliphilus]|uniref:Acetyltransferase n=1 Tax=Halalkalibacter alkaliphilus TaxID=2917993 RepID=A0A9X2CRG0_9BACI|nr:acetyltransferase [Halalkalibacter alkaliphilus]
MKVVIIGHGGHSKVLSDLILSIEEMKVIGYLDDKYNYFQKKNELYTGPIASAHMFADRFEDIKFVIGIGNNEIRKKVVSQLDLPMELFTTLIHPSAIISPEAKIGYGTVIMPYSIINSDTQVGNHTIINTGAIVEHDCHLEDFTHISPNATITGSVVVQEGAHIGAGATIIPNISIGAWSTIGAGATVISHIPAYSTAVGIPAKLTMKEGDKLVQ